ncbi:MAG: isocitrate/isopropylmalate dehydrogenase family protein [Candidatus Gastranaerophilaceae bacterium]|jgi:isocitrate dehydrogenase (NAD+)
MKKITLIPGDGIGPEITEATLKVIEATGLKLEWDIQNAGSDVVEVEGTPLPKRVIDSIKNNKIALKGPVTTPIGKGFRSINVELRKDLNLYACLRPAKSIPGIKSRYENIDLIVVRENTEDLYAGIERKIDENRAESVKLITREASEKITKYAFEYAVKNNRKKITAATKANICKFSDGLFLEAAGDVAKNYPQITFEEILVDNLCMQLVQNPEIFDVLVLPNLYGDIISDLTAGLIGGLGIAPGANIGEGYAVFEAVHGSAPTIKGLNKANPIALILSAVMMLKYIGENEAANRINKAVLKVIAEGKYLTPDLGGSSTTSRLTDAIISHL